MINHRISTGYKIVKMLNVMPTDSSPLSGGGGGFSYRPPRRGTCMSQPGINYILF